VLRTAVCDLLGIKHPIVQGGMAHVGTAELVAAVSNAGGLGIIGAGHYPADWVRQQIVHTRELTSRPFGVNLPLASPELEPVIAAVIAENVAIVATGAGDPSALVPRFKRAGMTVMAVVGSVALARRVAAAGADVIVAEGMESGGRIGETTTMALVPQVVDAVSVPVIAAGGIADGRGLVAALALGAQGVQIGTRFICTTECVAHPLFKERLIQADDRATTVTRQTTGQPLRTLRNKLSDQVAELERAGVRPEELALFDRGRMYLGMLEGDLEEGSLLAGQIAGLVKEIKPVAAVIAEIMTEAEALIGSLYQSRRKTGNG